MSIENNLSEVKELVEQARSNSGLAASTVSIIAVSKTQTADRIETALKAGHSVFGENRLQEAQEKWPGLKEKYPNTELHLIGPLQTNKVKKAVALFDVIETIDRPKLARAVAKALEESGLRRRLFIQVNTGEEDQKGGVIPAELPNLLETCQQELGLDIEGLMCIPPTNESPSLHFALLRKLARRHGLASLSMGMSSDYVAAVELGATHVRVGTGIFGARN